MAEHIIMQHSISDIEFMERKKIEASDSFVTLTRFHKLGEEAKLDMIMLTPEEAKTMADALDEIILDYKQKGIL